MRKVTNKWTIVIGMTTEATSLISDSHPASDLGEITCSAYFNTGTRHGGHRGVGFLILNNPSASIIAILETPSPPRKMKGPPRCFAF